MWRRTSSAVVLVGAVNCAMCQHALYSRFVSAAAGDGQAWLVAKDKLETIRSFAQTISNLRCSGVEGGKYT